MTDVVLLAPTVHTSDAAVQVGVRLVYAGQAATTRFSVPVPEAGALADLEETVIEQLREALAACFAAHQHIDGVE